ncbi:hypothetical protein FGO68_gene10609 [Halteria grandinella]|uniref:Uncharacterized protein n=1 Tax=Halteria grandinella TaxID=5974 RepID=A0A8J8SWV0_HALGN|nr:hypothetical protein FGO68_gene10609 [Halteria grandinella]
MVQTCLPHALSLALMNDLIHLKRFQRTKMPALPLIEDLDSMGRIQQILPALILERQLVIQGEDRSKETAWHNFRDSHNSSNRLGTSIQATLCSSSTQESSQPKLTHSSNPTLQMPRPMI